MSFTVFDLERAQSIWEQQVDVNLTESGVHPIRLDALLGDDPAHLAELMATEISYPHVNGNPAFGMDHVPRIAFGPEKSVLIEAFARIQKPLESLNG